MDKFAIILHRKLLKPSYPLVVTYPDFVQLPQPGWYLHTKMHILFDLLNIKKKQINFFVLIIYLLFYNTVQIFPISVVFKI